MDNDNMIYKIDIDYKKNGMSKQRKLQIDVKGPMEADANIIEMVLFVDGRACQFYTSKANYEALIYDGVFVRYGKEKDNANCINTTNVYVEQ
jgi:hypothetical protein